MSNVSVSPRSAAALKGWETRRAKAASQMVAQPVQQQQAKARAPKTARGERRYVTVRDTETGEIHRVLTSVASVGVAVVIFSPSNRHRQGALRGMLITHDDIRKAWVFNNEAEARHMLSNNRAPGERVIRAELVADPAPMVPQPVQQAQCNAAPVAAPVAPSEAIETAPQTVIRSAASIRANLDPALVVPYRWFRALDGRSGSFCLNAAEALKYARMGVETAPARAYRIDDAERDLSDFIGRHPEPVSEIASDGPPAATVIHSAQSIRDAINPAHLPRISEASPDLYSLLSEISRLSVDHDGNPVPVALDEEARDNIRAVLSWCEGLI